MISKLLRNRFIEILIFLILVSGVVFTIFTPQQPFFIWSSSMAVQALIVYVLLGLIFLVFKQEKLLFTSFICAGVLALFLKGNFNSNLKLAPKTDAASFNVTHYNLSSLTTVNQLFNSITTNKSDILSIQEVNPEIKNVLYRALKPMYPYSYYVGSINFGTSIFSKYPFVTVDTISINGIANVLCGFRLKGFNENVYLLSTYSTPPIGNKELENYKRYLLKIITWSYPINSPLILAGEMNAVPWSNEIIYLRDKLKLKDCRRAYYPSLPNIMERPMDHMFYSGKISCVDFHELRDSAYQHIGITASFQKRTILVGQK